MSHLRTLSHAAGVALVIGWSAASAVAQPLSLAPTAPRSVSPFDQVMATQAPYEATQEEQGAPETPAQFRRQIVSYGGREAAGTIIVDTPNTYLYYVLGNGQAVRYGIGVGREGFTWSGTKTVERKDEWPDWVPPTEMIERQPYLPRFMAGGPGNPLGARALYSAAPCTASTAPTSRRRSASACRRAVSACSTRTSSTSTRAPMSAPRSLCCPTRVKRAPALACRECRLPRELSDRRIAG